MNEYKDKEPKETINNIKQFFINKGYEIFEEYNEKSEINTWWCHLILRYNNNDILFSNGKGLTEEYSLASGYAELYERFCNYCNTVYENFFINKKFKDYNFKNYNYYLTKDEKEITLYELRKTIPKVQYLINEISTRASLIEEMLLESLNNHLIALPYKSILDNEQIYIVPELLQIIERSNGMCTGNSLEEAFIQGISEIFERITLYKIFKNINTDHFIELNISNINLKNEVLKDCFNLLKEKYNIKIFDFSYTYNLPVIGIFVFDSFNNIASLSLGAHPVFEIALERCITELYQGHKTLQDIYSKKQIMEFNTFKNYAKPEIVLHNIYNEHFYLDNEIKDNYNLKIFINDNSKITNIEIFSFIKMLLSMNHYKFYYRNNSQDPNIFALQIFDNNDDTDYPLLFTIKSCRDIKDSDKKEILNQLLTNYKLFNNILNNQNLSILDIDKISKINLNHLEYASLFLNSDPMYLYNIPYISFYQIFNNFINMDLKQVNEFQWNEYIKQKFKKYKILFGLKSFKNENDIIKISSKFNINFTHEEFLNKKSPFFYIFKIIWEPFYNEYFSENYNNFIESLINTNMESDKIDL